MFIILIRTILLYFMVLITIRIMGKSELSKMSPFQLVVIFMIAELASIPIESPEVSVIKGITAIFTLLFLQVLISFLSIKSEWFKNFISGKPSIHIDRGRINFRELKALRISINDLMEQLRLGNSPSIADVDYAVMESNGDLSIILKADKQPATAGDLGMVSRKNDMPLVIISDGCLYRANLARCGCSEKNLRSRLLSLGISSFRDVFLAFCDEKSMLHVYQKTKNGMAEEVIL